MLFHSNTRIVKPTTVAYLFNEESIASSFFKENIHRSMDSICVSKIGRVEGVSVSPNSKKVAYSSFDLNKILIFDIKESNNAIEIEKCVLVDCNFDFPHDLAWIDNSTIVVANREGPAIVFAVPNQSGSVKPLLVINDEIISKSNSVAVLKNENSIKMFFCDKHKYISFCEIDKNFNIKSKGIYLEKHLKVPDGMAISPCKKLLAVTNALKNNVVICDLNNNNNIFELEGIDHPHSVDFLTDDIIMVTGRNDPFVYCLDIKNKFVKFKFKCLNDYEYSLRHSDAEGGIKGICFCRSLNFLFLTCPNKPFMIFDVNILMKNVNIQ
jgi:WD40 repeat protein